jgi:uncharacterized protein
MDSTSAAGPEPEPWGKWGTLGWAVIAFLAGQVASLVVLVAWQGRDVTVLLDRPFDAMAVTVIILVSNPIAIAIAALAARLAHWNVADYLGLAAPPRRDVVLGVVLLVVLIPVCDGLIYFSGHDLVTPFQVETYTSAAREGWLPAMWLAVCVVGPAGEEVLFRGLMYRGWVRPDRSVWLPIVAISLVFALLHVQYDIFGIGQIFVIGLFLGWMRWRSGSTWLTFLLHCLINIEGTLETVVQLRYFS